MVPAPNPSLKLFLSIWEKTKNLNFLSNISQIQAEKARITGICIKANNEKGDLRKNDEWQLKEKSIHMTTGTLFFNGCIGKKVV